MKYVMLFGSSADDDTWGNVEPDRQKQVYGEIMAWWEEHAKAGRILDGERLAPVATATTVRLGPDEKPVVTDGPFVEAKDVIGGFGVIEVDDLDAAIALAKTWPALQIEGESVEIRPVHEM